MQLRHIFYFVQKLRVLLWWFTRPLTLGVKGLVFDKQGRVLLVKHTYQPGWHIPGGKVEKGESLVEAMLRELREEVGIDLSASAKKLFSVYANFGEYKSDHVAMFVINDVATPVLKPRPFEIEQSGFFSPDNLPAGTTPATIRRIREWLNGSEAAVEW